MKKIIAVALILMLLVGLMALAACKAKPEKKPADSLKVMYSTVNPTPQESLNAGKGMADTADVKPKPPLLPPK